MSALRPHIRAARAISEGYTVIAEKMQAEASTANNVQIVIGVMLASAAAYETAADIMQAEQDAEYGIDPERAPLRFGPLHVAKPGG